MLPTGTPANPRVHIVILHWNNFAATERCLRTLLCCTYPAATIWAVDNHSADDSVARLQAAFAGSPVHWIRNEDNLGFAAGCNEGIKAALRTHCDYVLLLNNDCVVHDPLFLDAAVAMAESDRQIGIVGGKILFWPNTTRIWSTGGHIDFWGAEVHYGHGSLDQGHFDTAQNRRFISGALMLIKRTVIERLGPLPDVYFFGKEEWEYSARAIAAGFRLVYCPAFSVCHEASNSHEWSDPTYVYNGTLSRILYKRRNHSRPAFWTWYLVYAAYVYLLLSVRYRLRRSSYIQCVDEQAMRAAMRRAVREGIHVSAITSGHLRAFRASLSGGLPAGE